MGIAPRGVKTQMTMTATGTPAAPASRFRWSWLWGPKLDFAWNFMPFWLGFAMIGALYLTRPAGAAADPMWSLSISGQQFNIMVLATVLYGLLIDGPHLWATIARTYTDAEEWAARRKLFLTSLLAFAVGPAIILAPYLVNLVTPLPPRMLNAGWWAWGVAFGFYALYHINKQHWGFVSLYRRKNGDTDPTEGRIDAIFFNVAIWLPYVSMKSAPWGTLAGSRAPEAAHAVFNASHLLFVAVCLAYVAYQVAQWRKGVVRNGPKLLYIGTIITLYYLTFAIDPRIAFFWVFITGTGHCAQYHAVVWAYGKKRYEVAEQAQKRLPHLIFSNVWLYLTLGLLFALFTLQGPGADAIKNLASDALETSIFSHAFTFLSPSEGHDLGFQLLTAFIAGVRLHHFYVDSKIWKVSKSQALAKNLSV